MYNLLDEDLIYCSKTKEYFKEVLSNYSSGNYRSAVVILYSVAICDLLFKLQELKDMYNDAVANKILIEVEAYRSSASSQSKARWEKELVDQIYRDTKLLSLEEYTNLNHLYDHRNFSAHPALNVNYELISPSRETTISHITNIFSGILIKPPIFISNIIDHMSNDLDEKRELYRGQNLKLQEYLNRKYFERMPISMKKSVFKAFWKFCFRMPDDEVCERNIKINRRVLSILFETCDKEILDFIKNDVFFSVISQNDGCLHQLCYFLAECPSVYVLLSQDTKLQIDSLIEKSNSAKIVSWFLSTSLEIHLKKMIDSESFGDLLRSVIDFVVSKYINAGLSRMIMDYFIEYFARSSNFNYANDRYSNSIQPNLSYMDADNFAHLIRVINANRQIHGRASSYSSNTEIMLVAKKLLAESFRLEDYPKFSFDQTAVFGVKREEGDKISAPSTEEDL